MFWSRWRMPDREAHESGYEHGFAAGYKSKRMPRVMRPEVVPARYDVTYQRHHYVAGWQKGFAFALKTREMSKAL